MLEKKSDKHKIIWRLFLSGYRAMDCLSNEKGYRHWHSDVRSDDTPLEANLAFTCKLKTGIDFLGEGKSS